MRIYKFNSILKPVLWGGDKLVAFKRLPDLEEPIGESWELSAMPGRESIVADGDDKGLTLTQLVQRYGAGLVGEDVYRCHGDAFPLLIKFIDARRDLSVQVHPDDAMARRLHGCSGKNEMWYVLQADGEAVIRTGFSRDISPEEYDRRVGDGTILEVINRFVSHQGDVFFIPAGQIHAIGSGNLVVEIQQSCDITYRVWDYDRRDADGNLRELHTQQAREALDFCARDCLVSDKPLISTGLSRLVRCPEFEVDRLEISNGRSLNLPLPHSFVAMVCIDGKTTLRAEGMPQVTLRQGETALVPAIVPLVEMDGTAELLMVSIPVDKETDL